MTAPEPLPLDPRAVEAAASALSVHLGDPGDWYDIAAVAVAAAAPVLLAPVQAEVDTLIENLDDERIILGDALRERDEARAEVERLTALVNAKQSWIDGAKVDLASSDEAVAVARRCIAAAIRGRCVDHQHEWDDGGAREDVCRRCDAAARIAEGDA